MCLPQRAGWCRAKAWDDRPAMSIFPACASFDGVLATGLRDVTRDLTALDSSGWWAVVATFEGDIVCARFDEFPRASLPSAQWNGPPRSSWTTSMTKPEYEAAVERIRELIAEGAVYQVNLCRVLSAPIAPNDEPPVLAERLNRLNPAPFGGVVHLPDHGVGVVSASPELFVKVADHTITSRPIKGTTTPAGSFGDKDHAENVMIVDLVRNDLGMVSTTGSVTVPELCVREEHPGLSHLVSTVVGQLRDGVSWPQVFEATFPPGSVSGAPKSAALKVIRALEPVPRGPYCGAVGWVDADQQIASLAVGIRSFWWQGDTLNLGTGAGITWSSTAEREWDETELKASRLLAAASH